MAIRIAGVDVINDDLELVRAKLTDIDETINDTAVDVFIYDTSKDSDGGAWRHRTQHTSWYAEASSASRDVNTRSTRAEFPAVAVIVAESDKVTIYDGDDPSLPMWMVFDRTGSSGLGILTDGADQTHTAITAIKAMNGKLFSAKGLTPVNTAWGGITSWDLISEVAIKATTRSTGYVGTAHIPFSERNSITVTGQTFSDPNPQLVNDTANDIAVTVLPDAPTDAATGLEIPTIAVATDGGVSVIKDDGTVVDSQLTNSVNKVSFSNDASRLFIALDGGSVHNSVATSSLTADAWTFDNNYYRKDASNTTRFPWIADDANSASSDRKAAKDNYGSPLGLTRIDETPGVDDTGMGAWITSSYTTGWLPGDIKMAALADTTAETFGDAVSGATVSDPNLDGVYDGEHVTNGDFATGDLTGWTAYNATGAVSGGEATITITSAAGGYYQIITAVAGQTYVVSADMKVGSGATADLRLYDNNSLSNLQTIVQTSSSTYVPLTATITPTYNFFLVYLRGADATNETIIVDNVSVRLADPDRSVNGNGLGVHGSITKTAVATGADVVGYSNFSSSNYLEQPYNGDLDFGAYTGTAGTGDFCVMGWVKTSSDARQYILSRYSASNFFLVRMNSGGTVQVFPGTGTSAVSASQLDTDTWRFVAAVRSNGVMQMYVDGVADGSPITNAADTTDTDATLTVGITENGPAYHWQGSLALIRISATAPTADQIRKIYEDEKVLFQPNAKATLTGSSDAVTALAHDPDTNLLHVGTSGGRSVFQGLRRVEEHTGTNSQSLAAISAVDGLVVEGK
jgi:hypothetical protein